MAWQMPQRIAVIGSPGAGKSTLATALAAATGLPLVHLDREYWLPGWVEPDPAEWQARSARLVAAERWVIDGNYGSSLATRLHRATLVIWLDLPTTACVAGVIRRALRHRGRARSDMREGCPERLNRAFLAFLWYILTFRRAKRPGIMRHLATANVPVIRIGSSAERARFAEQLPSGGLAGAMALPG